MIVAKIETFPLRIPFKPDTRSAQSGSQKVSRGG